MTVAVTVKVQNVSEFVRTLERMEPRRNRHWVGRALLRSAEEVQRLAAEKYIIRGGRVRVAGPRGGRGRLTDRPAAHDRLTSRSGFLRASIQADRAINRSGLPRFVEVSPHVEYAAIHELGGTIRISDRMRRVLHAKGIHPRKSTTQVRMPARPFLAPALEEASKSFGALFVREWERARDE